MRTTKFRALYKPDGKIYPVILLNFDPSSGLPYSVTLGAPLTVPTIVLASDIELIQFTDRKDEKSQEIYEGDILATTDINQAILGVVEWRDSTYIIRTKGNHIMDLRYMSSISLVIGNIYENPELAPEAKEQ